jgi:hypothetical protein
MSRRVLVVAEDTSEELGGKVKDMFPGKAMPRPGKPSAVRGSAEVGRVRLEGPKGFVKLRKDMVKVLLRS